MISFIQAVSRLLESETRNSNNLRFGTVSEVDPAKQRMRMRLGGTDAEPFLSPWLPYGQTAGALKLHSPPSIGQQFALMSNGGDLRQSVAVPFTWSDENASPSTLGNEHVMTFGSVKMAVREKQVIAEIGPAKIDITDEKITVQVGATKFEWTSAGFTAVSASVDWTKG
ncbi:MAG: phage baseplate assembly protein V [Burkholderiales bacterium]|nr:phage baseplate assembly protein V [Burkholderiales bacterium]